MIKDLGILWEWEYDERFVKLLDTVCNKAGKTSYLVAPHNLEESMAKIMNGEMQFKVVFDRATDSDPAFLPIIQFHQEAQCRIINEPENALHTNNKAVMHLEFVDKAMRVPQTIMLSPQDKIDDKALEAVGKFFVIKPAEGEGGGKGVIVGAETLQEIYQARENHPGKMLLIQELIVPRYFRGMRCWFRVFFVCGNVIPCFWDDQTHIYKELTLEEKSIFKENTRIAKKIHQITGLEFFSTEVAQTEDQKFVVVDYVNDQCDMRFQSDTPDGVPDSVIEEIVEVIVSSL
jgi:glutathione synthase/RimK-type ligase-like ATP-grasp enzyme